MPRPRTTFPRIEANYLTALGRTAEADGEKAIWQDLRARLYVSEPELKADYAASPEWLKKLMNAWAAGLNYYLATHPEVKPRVLTRFEPWMALELHGRKHRRRYRTDRPRASWSASTAARRRLLQRLSIRSPAAPTASPSRPR